MTIKKEELIFSVLDLSYIKLIEEIINDVEDMDNNSRADRIAFLVSDAGLVELGCGTNRIVFEHPDYPNYVYKIGLDKRGVKDNNLEEELSKDIPEEYRADCYANVGIISVQEKLKVMNSDDMRENKDEVIEKLITLSSNFVLNDVGPKQFLNWGFKNGKPALLDYAYLRKITPGMEFICTYNDCGGQLAYTKNFANFKCIECGHKFSISEIQDEIYNLIESRGLVTK